MERLIAWNRLDQKTLRTSWGIPYNSSDLVMDEDEMFFIFRSYMEPATNVSPDDNELLYDQAIYFGPYFEPETASV